MIINTMFTKKLSIKFSARALLLVLLPVFNVSALQWQNGDLQVHGFLGQGLVYTDHNNVFGTSQDVSLDFREMGVNASYKVLPNLLISAQGLYRDAGASDELGVRLDYAQIDYSQPFLNSDAVLGVRGGRVKIPFGLYNETRDVIWTRPTVLLPQSIYFDTLALRQAMISADGGMIYGRYTNGNHRFGLEFLAAEPRDNVGGAASFLSGIPNAQGAFSGRPLLVGRSVYEWLGGRGRLMFSVVELDRDFKGTPGTVPATGNVKILYPLFSAQYNAEKWSLTGEYGWIDSSRQKFIPGLETKIVSENFYLQGEYRFNTQFSGVVRYDVLHFNRADRDGKAMAAATGLPSHRFYARDLTLGVRWEFNRNFMVAADYHWVNGTAWLNDLDNPTIQTGGGSPSWNMFTTMFSFRF
jgi:hypothetical protein